MSEAPLVQTKLFVPRARRELVPRPHLLSRLNEGIDRRLTLISGPAGFGKTTLVAQWVRGGELPAAWLSLDEGDNDLKRFLSYLVAALETIPSQSHPDVRGILAAPQPSIEDALATLINDLEAVYGGAPQGRRLMLVLDDYHLIHQQAVHQVVAYLLEHLPRAMHLVIVTRADPPLPLARLRARAQLTELRAVDLRFTNQEASDFLNRVMGFSLKPKVIGTLAERTEGWIAGLQMAAVSMRGRQDLDGFVQAFRGSNRYILDYLLEEVLQRQPEEIQSFLLQTAILNRMSAELCAELVGDEGGSLARYQEILEYLDQANLFVVPLDDRREWYRYHRLFADLLRKRLQNLHPELVPVLHGKAGRWFERAGWVSEAVNHALAAGDAEHAAGLIEQAAESMLQRSEIGMLENWIDRLPSDLVQSRPQLDLYRLISLMIAGHSMEIVEPGLERLIRLGVFPGEVRMLQAYQALFQARFSLAEELARQGLAELPEEANFLRSTGQWIASVCHLDVNDLRQREQVLESLVWKTQAMENRFFHVSTICQLAEVHMSQGRLPDAHERYRQALKAARGPDDRLLPIAGQALIGMGHILREWNRLEEARRLIVDGIEQLLSWSPYGAMEGYLALANCCLVQGDTAGVEQALKDARRMAQAFDTTQIDDRVVGLVSAQLKLRQGDPAPMRRYFREHGIAFQSVPDSASVQDGAPQVEQIDQRLRKYEDLLRAQVLLFEGRFKETLELLAPLQTYLETNNRIMMLVEVELLRALALQALGKQAQAQETFERALTLAEPGGFVRRFIDEGRPVAGLLHEALRRGVCPDYAGRLLAALEKELSEEKDLGVTETELPALLEPLSDRELEVLRYLNSSLTVPEIAERLFVAESTVRSHVKSIYSKLDVHRRQEAVRRGEALRLIP